jgi:threonine dehydrogenase-like Zn-dependent dehydrogenase
MVVPIFKGNGSISYEPRPIPTVEAPDDVVIRVEACGICGTDLNILAVPPAHKATAGIIIGHEAVGLVDQIGSDVAGLQPGDRVVVANRLTCGRCGYCRRGLDNQCTSYQTIGTTVDGAFAPYLRAPARALWKIDPVVLRDDAALFEPLACVVGSIKRVPFQAGDHVVIIGGGPMGMLFALVYRAMGAGKIVVVDLAPFRLEFARTLGLDAALNATAVDVGDEIRRLTGLGADIVVDAVGNQLALAASLARRGGQVILFGLRPHDNPPINQYTITRFDLTVHGTFVGLHPFAQTIQLLESGRVRPSSLVTHRLPLHELERGVEMMRTQQAMKVLIDMNL